MYSNVGYSQSESEWCDKDKKTVMTFFERHGIRIPRKKWWYKNVKKYIKND